MSTLTEQQVLELKVAHKQTREKRLADRIKAILMLHFGFTYDQIKQALLLDEVTLRRYLKKYQKYGLQSLLEYRYTGGQTRLTLRQEQELTVFLKDNTKRTAKDVAEYIRTTYAVSFSIIGATKLLHRLGFTYKKPKTIPGKANRTKQEEFLKTYQQMKGNLNRNDQIYFVDATHPEHNTKPSYGWILKGKDNDKYVKTNTGRERLNLNGALNLKGKMAVILEEQTINSHATITLFQKLAVKQPKGKIYIILDNARYHHSKIVKLWLKRHKRFKLVFLPTYSPNLNIIERLWRFFHQKVTWNHYFETFEEFRSETLKFFKNLNLYEKEVSTLLTDNFQLIPNLHLQT